MTPHVVGLYPLSLTSPLPNAEPQAAGKQLTATVKHIHMHSLVSIELNVFVAVDTTAPYSQCV